MSNFCFTLSPKKCVLGLIQRLGAANKLCILVYGEKMDLASFNREGSFIAWMHKLKMVRCSWSVELLNFHCSLRSITSSLQSFLFLISNKACNYRAASQHRGSGKVEKLEAFLHASVAVIDGRRSKSSWLTASLSFWIQIAEGCNARRYHERGAKSCKF